MQEETKLDNNHWTEKLLSTVQADLVATLFPFKAPPLEVAKNCLVIADSSLQLREAYHDTASSVFVLPRQDKKLLVPAIAFDENYPALNLWVLVSDTLPVTHELTNRKWSVWCGRNLLKNQQPAPLYFTPEAAQGMVDSAREAKRLYERMLEGDKVETDEIKKLMSQFVLGVWLDHYTNDLPRRIAEQPEAMEEEIKKIFSGFEQKVELANEKYKKLTDEDRLLLDQAFRVIVKTKLADPFAYFSAEVDAIRNNQSYNRVKSSRPRNPLEIVGRTQGVSLDEVDKIFIPDEILNNTGVGAIAKERIKSLGLDHTIKPFSEIGDVVWYETCGVRYEKFDTSDLIGAIKDKRLVPLVPSEWQNCNFLS